MLRFILILLLNLHFTLTIHWVGDFSQFSSWNIKFAYLTENRQIVKDPLGGTETVLKVKYPAGSYSTATQKGGTGFFVYPFPNITTGHVSLEYDVLFPLDFEFVLGGKIPGLFGGRHTCSGGDTALDCWSGRLMWGKNGGGFGYFYLPKTAPHLPEFCALTDDAQCKQKYGFSLKGDKYFEKGKWTRVKETVKLNTPGQANGRILIEINGIPKFDFNKVIFRTTNNVPVHGFAFETCKKKNFF